MPFCAITIIYFVLTTYWIIFCSNLNSHEHITWHCHNIFFYFSCNLFGILIIIEHVWFVFYILLQHLNKCWNFLAVNHAFIRFWHDRVPEIEPELVDIVCFHQSMSRWGNEELGNYTNIISLPRNCSLIAQFGASSNFETLGIAFCFVSN